MEASVVKLVLTLDLMMWCVEIVVDGQVAARKASS